LKKLLALAVGVLVAALAVPALAATRTVSVADNVFKPSSLTVRKSDTVRFRWTGRAPHNVVVTKGPVKFRSSTKTSGTYTKRMTRAGRYTIVCTIHPGMDMRLRVR
jgi:plastocyanin